MNCEGLSTPARGGDTAPAVSPLLLRGAGLNPGLAGGSSALRGAVVARPSQARGEEARPTYLFSCSAICCGYERARVPLGAVNYQ